MKEAIALLERELEIMGKNFGVKHTEHMKLGDELEEMEKEINTLTEQIESIRVTAQSCDTYSISFF
jgi:predicted nuclease with TOPRIM domain